jgi:plastocyanin
MVGLIALGAGCAQPPDFGGGTDEPPTTEPGATTGAPETTEVGETTEMTETTEAPETTTPEGEVVDVVAGPPNNTLRFEPDSVEIAVGDTVRWTFESAGHNVTSLPGASEKVQNPENAEPFASYEGTQHFAIMEVGSTFEHTFTVPGEYTYVCAPHEDQGMVGSITVTER